MLFPINDTRRYKFDFDVPPEDREILRNELQFGSEHSGGAQFAFCDGSVHFIDDSINLEIFKELATKRGGEVNRWEP